MKPAPPSVNAVWLVLALSGSCLDIHLYSCVLNGGSIMTLAKYGIGFGLSLLLTLAAYSLVMYGGASPMVARVDHCTGSCADGRAAYLLSAFRRRGESSGKAPFVYLHGGHASDYCRWIAMDHGKYELQHDAYDIGAKR